MALSVTSICTWLLALLLSTQMDHHEYSLSQHEREERNEEIALALEREGFDSLDDLEFEARQEFAAAQYCATIKQELPFLLP